LKVNYLPLSLLTSDFISHQPGNAKASLRQYSKILCFSLVAVVRNTEIKKQRANALRKLKIRLASWTKQLMDFNLKSQLFLKIEL
jgi:hypothetical protein